MGRGCDVCLQVALEDLHTQLANSRSEEENIQAEAQSVGAPEAEQGMPCVHPKGVCSRAVFLQHTASRAWPSVSCRSLTSRPSSSEPWRNRSKSLRHRCVIRCPQGSQH